MVQTQLAALAAMALADRWTQVFGSPAPTACRALLLRSALSWQVQASAASPATSSWQKLLSRQRPTGSSVQMGAGTRLAREWQGRMHQVTVQDQGFEYQGTRYRSLTAIARVITGTPWSGPAFFGLRK
jgi:hypothetical protein